MEQNHTNDVGWLFSFVFVRVIDKMLVLLHDGGLHTATVLASAILVGLLLCKYWNDDVFVDEESCTSTEDWAHRGTVSTLACSPSLASQECTRKMYFYNLDVNIDDKRTGAHSYTKSYVQDEDEPIENNKVEVFRFLSFSSFRSESFVTITRPISVLDNDIVISRTRIAYPCESFFISSNRLFIAHWTQVEVDGEKVQNGKRRKHTSRAFRFSLHPTQPVSCSLTWASERMAMYWHWRWYASKNYGILIVLLFRRYSWWCGFW